MNNPNFHSAGEFDGYPSNESNGGADNKNKKKKRSEPGKEAVSDEQPTAGLNAVTELFRRRGILPAQESAKKAEPTHEAVIYTKTESTEEKEEDHEAEASSEEFAADEYESADELGPDEEQEVVKAYTEIRDDELQAESAVLPPEDDERPAIAADAALLQAITRTLNDRASEPTERMDHVTEAIDAAYEETSQRVRENQVEPLETALPDDEDTVEATPASASEANDTGEQSLAAYAAAQAPSSIPPRRYGPHANMATANFAPMPNAPVPGRHGSEMGAEGTATERAAVNEWFVPAAAAYLWGRHHGRKRAENRLKPQQQKLETTVRNLVAEVAAKEARIRQLARAQATQEKPVVSPIPHHTETKAPSLPERPMQKEPSSSTEVKPAAPFSERIASFAQPAAAKAENTQSLRTSVEVAPAERRTPPEVMNREELLAAGAEIKIGSVDLRSIYEDNKISEEGLRRLIVEHHHGGDVRAILKDEMLKKEMSFELDPMQHYGQQDHEAMREEQQPVLPSWLKNETPMASSHPAPVSFEPALLPQTPPTPPSPAVPQPPDDPIPEHARNTIQPVLMVANVTAFVTLAILLAVLVIILIQR